MKDKIFVIFLLTLLFVSVGSTRSFAQKTAAPEILIQGNDTLPAADKNASGGAAVGQEMKQTTDYFLPYPGILPDHPLYFLKDFRDKIIEMLIVDPARKSEFYLLQSDKWIQAARLLAEKGSKEKAQTILDQSSDRMTDAVSQLASLKDKGRDIPSGSIDRLEQAIQKHLEVLGEMTQSQSGLTVTKSQQVLDKAQDDVAKLRS